MREKRVQPNQQRTARAATDTAASEERPESPTVADAREPAVKIDDLIRYFDDLIRHLANDHDELQPDVIQNLATKLAIPFMELYRARLEFHREHRDGLLRRCADEQAEVDTVKRGKILVGKKRGRGAPKKLKCKRGHPRTPDNVTAHGSCKQCDAYWQRRRRKMGGK